MVQAAAREARSTIQLAAFAYLLAVREVPVMRASHFTLFRHC